MILVSYRKCAQYTLYNEKTSIMILCNFEQNQSQLCWHFLRAQKPSQETLHPLKRNITSIWGSPVDKQALQDWEDFGSQCSWSLWDICSQMSSEETFSCLLCMLSYFPTKTQPHTHTIWNQMQGLLALHYGGQVCFTIISPSVLTDCERIFLCIWQKKRIDKMKIM